LSLVDASTIFEALRSLNLKPLENAYTLDLARYEVGNVIYKQGGILNTLNWEESRELMLQANKLISILTVVDVSGSEVEVLELAKQVRATFTDASYLYTEKRMNLTLLTEDMRMAANARTIGVETRMLTRNPDG
jgi:predicted nucleic acid-binding protein